MKKDLLSSIIIAMLMLMLMLMTAGLSACDEKKRTNNL